MSLLRANAEASLRSAGYDLEDPAIIRLISLVNLAAAPPGLDKGRFKSDSDCRKHAVLLSVQYMAIGRLLIEAKSAGVDDSHLEPAYRAAPVQNGRRKYGRLLYDAATGWEYIPPDSTYVSQKTTYRRAVCRALKEAIRKAEGRKTPMRKRAPVTERKEGA